jgi:Tfp pilus assembly protein PilN
MTEKYTPPTRLIWENVNNALGLVTKLCKEMRGEINQLKEEKQLLRNTFNIQAELLKRSEYQVTQLKAEINLIDPTGERRLEYI